MCIFDLVYVAALIVVAMVAVVIVAAIIMDENYLKSCFDQNEE